MLRVSKGSLISPLSVPFLVGLALLRESFQSYSSQLWQLAFRGLLPEQSIHLFELPDDHC